MKTSNTLIIIVLVVLVGAGSFFAGTKYQQNKGGSRQFTNGAPGAGQFRNRTPGSNNGGSAVRGQVINMDDKSVTVKLNDGSSKIILFSNTTSINKADTASKSDIKSGDQIVAFGTTNSDGSVTAQNIQLNPQQFRGGQGQSPNPNQ